jgi:hypothetical protein
MYQLLAPPYRQFKAGQFWWLAMLCWIGLFMAWLRAFHPKHQFQS